MIIIQVILEHCASIDIIYMLTRDEYVRYYICIK